MHSAAVFSHTAMELGFLLRFCATTSCKNSGHTSPSWGVINFPIISHTAAPLPPLSVLLARQKNVGNLSSQH